MLKSIVRLEYESLIFILSFIASETKTEKISSAAKVAMHLKKMLKIRSATCGTHTPNENNR